MADEVSSRQRRAMHETLTWLESWQMSPGVTQNTVVILEGIMRTLSALTPDDLCLHINPCVGFIEISTGRNL